MWILKAQSKKISDVSIVANNNHSAIHFEDRAIPVEFLVLHYTAQSLAQSLQILTQGDREVSCHLLLDERGEIYELVACLEGTCKKAFHAGPSRFLDSEGKNWENFNQFSLGIELVNWNGNIFSFTEAQYRSLFGLLSHLKGKYPALENPDRIVGHEHIAGFRGKKDPGGLFDWERLFKKSYPGKSPPKRPSVLSPSQIQSLSFLKNSKPWNDKRAEAISRFMEARFPSFFLKRIFFRFF